MSDEQLAGPSAVRVRLFGKTDVGRVREHNEDNFLIADLTHDARGMTEAMRLHTVGAAGTVLAVCDGMGGAAAGEVASQMAVDTLYERLVQPGASRDRDEFAWRLSSAIGEAGARIFLAAKSNRAQRGMGTTSTVAGLFGTTLFLGQVGDSRAYVMRNGRIKQVTKDQSLVSKLIESGQLTEEEAESYEHSHIILQALGTSDAVSVDLSFLELRKGDTLLVCSDGLSGLVTAEQMRETLGTYDSPEECCTRLIALANEAGGHDNVTVIVGRFEGDLPEPGPDDDYIGYQPYVITAPVDLEPAGRPSGRIKGADAPPPGKDVKFAASIRPPSAGNSDVTMDDDDEPLSVPVRRTSPLVVVAAVALLVGALVALGVVLMRRHELESAGARGAVPSESAAVVAAAPSGPATAATGTTVTTALPTPSHWQTMPSDGGAAAQDGGAVAVDGTAATADGGR